MPRTAAYSVCRRRARHSRQRIFCALEIIARPASVRGPVLIFHGTDDLLVPFDMGRRVAEAAQERGPVEFVILEGSGHNETYDVGRKAYKRKLADFVTGAR